MIWALAMHKVSMNNTDELIGVLNKISNNLDLKSKAYEGALYWINSDDFDVDKALTKDFRFEYKFQKFCFNSDCLDYPYIETQLDVYYKDEDIGYYCLYSLLDGEAVDDKLVITDHDFKNS
ncbi:hypothetical protein OLEAN_C16140 [Oleispira antarctica RB-8]|uniref:Uncharacterized protein n=1 Tax=Oleispira antarctica RB-8 TaxID=698738 RepID=R4YM60_OLEAN|nr:hypothetical protein OLEAN_C16140 [Oleispira antarctica RB-8]